MLNSDGDVVRGLGFVALFAAYLEEQIENLRSMLGVIEAVAERESKWPISKKTDKIKTILRNFDFENRDELLANLVGCEQLFSERDAGDGERTGGAVSVRGFYAAGTVFSIHLAAEGGVTSLLEYQDLH